MAILLMHRESKIYLIIRIFLLIKLFVYKRRIPPSSRNDPFVREAGENALHFRI
jgi:hypothetical protein